MQNDKQSLERREFLKISAKFGAMASLASLSGFALSTCDSKADKKDSTQNLQGTKTRENPKYKIIYKETQWNL